MGGFNVNVLETTSKEVEVLERLWLTADGNLVPDGDPAAERLFSTPGTVVPFHVAEQYGLVPAKKQAKSKAGDS